MLRSVSEFMRDAALTVKSGSWIKQKQFRFVVGNEACDLDSAVCAVARGLLLADVLEGSSVEKRVCAAPVLNIPRSELCLKTEVVFWFQDNGIEPDSFICWDEVDWSSALASDIVSVHLVDHNLFSKRENELGSRFFDKIVEVVDHHVEQTRFDAAVELNIHRVGSCASLVHGLFVKSERGIPPLLARLLLGPIIVDTVNLSPAAKVATDVDQTALAKLEEVLLSSEESESWDRNKQFSRLLAAKSDVSSLTSLQILLKDLKLVNPTKDVNPVAAVPTIPMKVSTFLKREDWEKALEELQLLHRVKVIVVMGVVCSDDQNLERDLGLFWGDAVVSQLVLDGFFSDKGSTLELEAVGELSGDRFKYFRQKNFRATRKFILPLVLESINNGAQSAAT